MRRLVRILAVFAVLAGTAAVSGMAMPAAADSGVVSRDLAAPGDGKLTFDPATGLEWLDLTETVGMTPAEAVIAYRDLRFSLADVDEVNSLLAAFDLTEVAGAPFVVFPAQQEDVQRFLDLLGVTEPADPSGLNGPASKGTYDDVLFDDLQRFIQVDLTEPRPGMATPEPSVANNRFSTPCDRCVSSSEHGVFLVRRAISDGPCGLIDSSVRLRRNETCDIEVIASGVTIDLGGRRLTGGITIEAGLSDLVIRNGEVRGVINLWSSRNAKIDRVTVRDGAAVAGNGTTVLRSRFVSVHPDTDTALWIDGDDVEVRSTIFERGHIGIGVYVGDDALITGVTFRDNDHAGVFVRDFSTDTSVGTVITNSTFERNLHGVILERWGEGTHGTVVQRSSFFRQRGSGVLLSLEGDGATGTLISDNRFIGNGRDGGDLFNDGITQVSPPDPDVTVRRNVTVLNADLGIDVDGVVDGGGNRGRKNGNDAQCVGVVCRR